MAPQQLGRPAASPDARQPGEPAHHAQVLLAGLQLVDGRVLAGQADAAADVAAGSHDIVAGDAGASAIGRDQG
jgi:hypothetical protein